MPVEVVQRLRQQDPDNQRLHDAMLISIDGVRCVEKEHRTREGPRQRKGDGVGKGGARGGRQLLGECRMWAAQLTAK